MNLLDMIDLVEMYEVVNEKVGIINDILFGNIDQPGSGQLLIGYENGIFGKLIKIEEIIWRNCIYYKDFDKDNIKIDEDPCIEMYNLLNDRNVCSEEKAKILLGINEKKVYPK